MLDRVLDLFQSSGLFHLRFGDAVMIGIGALLIYLAIFKKYEPVLLLPMGFGALLANLPETGLTAPGGLFHYISIGVRLDLYPPLIFLGVGAMVDFGPLLANPRLLLLGAAGQFGIFASFLGAILLGFDFREAGAIGIIGAADGPTAVYMTEHLASRLLGPVAVAAYSYMAMIPIIQPPLMRLLTTPEERRVKMEQLREVSKLEKILFPVVVAVVTGLLVPLSAPLVGMLMIGNILKESGVVDMLSKTVQNELINIASILLGIGVGSQMTADVFLTRQTIGILIMGLAAFTGGTVMGLLFGKLMYRLTGGKVNPLIGSAGISALPMAARVAHRMGLREDPSNFLIMHALAANVAGQVASPVAAAALFTLLR